MLSLSAAAGCGAAGGLITEAVVVWGELLVWQQARRAAMARGRRSRAVSRFIDWRAHLAVAATRAVLGAIAGWLLRGEIIGVYAALTVGASAPALLAVLGKAVTPAAALMARPEDGSGQFPDPRSPTPAQVNPEAAE
jgi:hypothetical protein